MPLPAYVEPPRLLAARSEHGYTDRPDLALSEEPEAVAADVQRALTDRARAAGAARSLDRWHVTRDRWRADLDVLASARFETEIAAELRTIARALDRIDKRLHA